MSIGSVCKKTIRLSREAENCQEKIYEYCNSYAQKLTGNPEFTFDCLPDEIVESLLYGKGDPNSKWAAFLKEEVRKGLIKMGFYV